MDRFAYICPVLYRFEITVTGAFDFMILYVGAVYQKLHDKLTPWIKAKYG